MTRHFGRIYDFMDIAPHIHLSPWCRTLRGSRPAGVSAAGLVLCKPIPIIRHKARPEDALPTRSGTMHDDMVDITQGDSPPQVSRCFRRARSCLASISCHSPTISAMLSEKEGIRTIRFAETPAAYCMGISGAGSSVLKNGESRAWSAVKRLAGS
jgi:hypothetical protein